MLTYESGNKLNFGAPGAGAPQTARAALLRSILSRLSWRNPLTKMCGAISAKTTPQTCECSTRWWVTETT